jgi:hypothetical protein
MNVVNENKIFKRKQVAGFDTYDLKISTNAVQGTITLTFTITSNNLPLFAFTQAIASKIVPIKNNNKTTKDAITKFFNNKIQKTSYGFIIKGEIITFTFYLKGNNQKGVLKINNETLDIPIGFKDLIFNLFTSDILNSKNGNGTDPQKFLKNSQTKIQNQQKTNQPIKSNNQSRKSNNYTTNQ